MDPQDPKIRRSAKRPHCGRVKTARADGDLVANVRNFASAIWPPVKVRS
jgi:hypothetical protein